MPRKGWTSITLTNEMIEDLDKIIKSDLGKRYGFKSRADFVTRACRRYLDEVNPPYKHINMMDDNVKICDFDRDRIATIYFKNPGGAHCDLCDADDCKHIDYALAQPDVQKALEKHGWERQADYRLKTLLTNIKIQRIIKRARDRPIALREILFELSSTPSFEETVESLIESGLLREVKVNHTRGYRLSEKGEEMLAEIP